MKLKLTSIFILSIVLISCKSEITKQEVIESNATYQNKGRELVSKTLDKLGIYNDLLERKDVVYTYSYQTPDGKKDISTEKYLFDGELSYGLYDKHERTFPDLTGQIEQGYDGETFWLRHNGETLNDTTRLKRVAFNRPTNFYWFAMMQKLLDPGLIYDYLGEKKINNTNYEIVKISFTSKDNKPTDIYQLYINKETLFIDQFLFTVADYGVVETPFLMILKYEEIDDLWIPSKRLYKKSNWEADVLEGPWIKVNWSDIKFNNNLSKTDFTNM